MTFSILNYKENVIFGRLKSVAVIKIRMIKQNRFILIDSFVEERLDKSIFV